MIFSNEAIAQRKKRAADALRPALGDQDTVLVFSGSPIQKPGGHDQTYSFLPHPDYYWLTGFRRPFGVSAFTLSDGWIDFVLPVSREEKIWEGGGEELPGEDLKLFKEWMAKRSGGRTFLLGNSKDYLDLYNAHEEEMASIQECFSAVRRIKDREEIELVRKISSMAAKGYQHLRNIIRPGMSEREIQIEYETQVLRAGAEKLPYDSIVGTGSNSAILHAIPTSRIVKEDEHILIDAGADLHDYCVDITRIFPANGKMSDRQRTIFNLVKKAQEESISLCRPGTEWKNVHLASARVMAQGLKDLGILNISPEEALSSGAIGVFFPHGVGHMVGLRVRDVGGAPNPHPQKYGGARLRIDMPLQEGFLMTVEPGLYFIPTLLNDEETRHIYGDQINWSEANKWCDFGGVRLEDDIHITKNGPENLTAHIEK